MRITGGTYGGRQLKTPKNYKIRPTSDKVRQAIFNMLEARGAVEDAVVLDAFCGTGALGLEALSRGAAYTIFIDKDQDSLLLCKDNIVALDVLDQCAGICVDSAKRSEKPEDLKPAHLIFMDPPYGEDLIPLALEALLEGGWIALEAFVVMEMGEGENIDIIGLEILQEKTYGDTKVVLAQIAPL